MGIFLLGANGTLGFQLALFARKKLNYNVRCLVRSSNNELDFLDSLGVDLFYGDIFDTDVLLDSMFGCNVVIDASTGRIYEKIEDSDINAKLLLLRVSKELSMERFIFFSLVNAEKFKSIPLIKAKLFLEKEIKNSKINYTIFRLTGFYQGIVQEYVTPILTNDLIYLTKEDISISYIDCMDVARLVLRSFTSQKFLNKTIDIGGNEAWKPNSILQLCETFSGLKPKIKEIDINQVFLARIVTTLFESAWPISRRLSLIDIVLKGQNYLITDPKELYEIFEINENELRELPNYLSLYIGTMLDLIISKFEGTLEDDEKELEEWKKKGVEVIEDNSIPNSND